MRCLLLCGHYLPPHTNTAQPVLQVLADFCSQPEAQRAALACASPSDTLLGVLLALAQQPHSAAVAEAAMLAVRQVALAPEAQAHFLSARLSALEGLLGALADAAQHPGLAAAAAHALWALVHGGERVKVAVRRCEGWPGSLQAALAACQRQEDARWHDKLLSGCQSLQRLLA